MTAKLRPAELLRLVADKIARGEDCREHIDGLRDAADRLEEINREARQLVKDSEPYVQDFLESQAPLDEFLHQRNKGRA